MSNSFPQYTTDYISGVMSLRKPQTESLKILEQILDHVPLRKGMDLEAALDQLGNRLRKKITSGTSRHIIHNDRTLGAVCDL